MAVRCAVVMRGMSKPLVFDFTSSIELASGELASALIPTCENMFEVIINDVMNRAISFFIDSSI
jgi:hypothetical protein